ncbi:MAG TPA: hypothetical protein ENK63_02415 [Rhodobacterales bacterium]|nr:hypothetical protein [Rhodobacterales bacterium]
MKYHANPLTLSKVMETAITVDAPKPIEELLARYSFVSDVFREEHKHEHPMPYTAHYSVWALSRSATPEEIVKALSSLGERPANGQDLLCFADVHPEACDPALIATGSGEHIGGHTGVPVVAIPSKGGSRAGEMFVERLSAGAHILSITPKENR